MKNCVPDGHHYLVEFFGCDPKQIESAEFWKSTLNDSIKYTEMVALHDFYYKFDPQGLTGFLLLSSSHISFHTWPENNYVVIDIFTCSSVDDIEKATENLKKKLVHNKFTLKKVRRGFQVCRSKGHVDISCISKKCIMQPIYATGEEVEIDIYDTLMEIESEFHKITFVDTRRFGKCLVINGVIQSAETDHRVYDQEMVKKLSKSDRKLLILGGGDGYIARMALEENPNVKIVVVELDIEVVKGCKNFLGQDIFEHPNVRLIVGDALQHLKHSEINYDGIICDLTDAPVGGGKEKDDFERFFQNIIGLSDKRLKDKGWISVQAGATKVAPGHIDAVAIIKNFLKDHFRKVERSDIFIPSFGESCAFLFGEKVKN